MSRTRSRWWAATLVALAACSGGSTATTLPPDPAAILEASARFMGEIDTVRFSIERDGAPVYIDEGENLEFLEAEGRFAAPGAADALVKVKALGLTTQVGAVAIDGEVQLSNPVTGQWEPAPDDFTFDPADLFDPDTGWKPLLASGLTDVELIGLDETTDPPRYHLRGLADGDRVEVITGGLVEQDVVLDLWIDAVTGAVAVAEFTVTTPLGETSWHLELFDYGVPVEITSPTSDA